MTTLRLTLIFAVLLQLIPGAQLHASQRVSNEAARTALVAKIGAKYAGRLDRDNARVRSRLEKKTARLMHKLARIAAIDLNDPVEKWMWFWLLSWAAGLILGVVGLAWFGWLLFVAGTVFLIIWLIRRAT